MSDIRPSDREMLDDLVERAGVRTPDYTEEVLAATRQVRQRPAWTFGSSWLPDWRPAPALRIALVAALVALVPVALLLGGGSAPGPTPSEPASPPVVVASPSASSGTTPRPTSSPLAEARYEACTPGQGASLTLTVWDRATDPDEIAALATLDAAFEAANPGIGISRVHVDPVMTADALVGAIASTTGPDVAQLPAGRTGLGAAGAAGLLLPLDDAATQYGWITRWGAGLLDRGRADDAGTTGQGTLYGVSSTATALGLFQNYEMSVNRPARPNPTELDEELGDLAAMADAGYVPLLVAGADEGLTDLYTLLATAASEPGWTTSLALERDGATFDTPAARHAAELLLEISRRGYLDPGYASLTDAAAVDRFATGSSELLVSTSDRNRMLNEQSNALGVPMFVVFPPATAGEPSRVVIRMGDPWVVRRGSTVAACAAGLVDFLTGDIAGNLLASHGIVPSHAVYTSPSLGSASFMDVMDLLRDASRADTTTYPLDDAFPAARRTIANGLARMLDGSVTPAQFTAEVEAAYRAYVGTLR